MNSKKNSISPKELEYFDPNAIYPEFDENARMEIDGKPVALINSLLDEMYAYPVPDKLENLALLPPSDNLLQEAFTCNTALMLVEKMRPSWPLSLMEWLTMPDLLIRAKREICATEQVITAHSLGTDEQKASLRRVAFSRNPTQLHYLSKKARKAVMAALKA